MSITPEEAQQELARRELSRRGINPEQAPEGPFDQSNPFLKAATPLIGPIGTFLGMSKAERGVALPLVGGIAGEMMAPGPGGPIGFGLGTAAGAKQAGVPWGPSIASGVGAGATAGVIGAGLGAVGKALPAFKTLFSDAEQLKLAKQSRGIFEQVKSGAGPAYEASMKQLGGKIDATPQVMKLLKLQESPEASSALTEAMLNAEKVGDTTLQKILAEPSLAKSLTPHQADQISTTLKQTSSSLRRFATMNPNVAQQGSKTLLKLGQYDKELGEVSNELTHQITALHPEAYPKITQQYGQTQQAARFLTPEFSARNNRLIKNMKSGFGGGEVAEQVKQTLPASASKKIFDVAKTQKNLDRVNPVAILKKFLGR